ncbi:MAG: enoyl-CoA hydratase/isomerase family protein [Novosphingobium sp.]
MAGNAPISGYADSQEQGLWHIRLDRPERRNAMSGLLVDAAITLLERAAFDDAIGVLVIHGAGTGFCAGSDLGELAGMDAAGRSAFEAASGRLARLVPQFPKPVIAAVHGYAIGGGLTLAAACDIVVTDPAARWSLPEVPIGLFPAWGLEAVVARIGRVRARRLSWGIDTLDGTQAAAIGLADEAADDPLARARDIARSLLALPRAQAQSVKHYFAAPHAPEVGDHAANALFMAATATPAAQASFERFGHKVRAD